VLAAFPTARTAEIEAGWEDRWRAFHHGARIGPLWVGPPWEDAPADALAVVVDPGRAFGTGAHPTTRLCLELLLGEEPGSVLDVGCGSGVLAIAAAKLGHQPVVAVDLDEAAVAATRANAERNAVALDALRVDALAGALPATDLALANIALEAVEALGGRLDVARLVTSGYPAADGPVLRGFRRLARRELDGWAADLHARR
jgi:ribosomal protein L11 methyltransferase